MARAPKVVSEYASTTLLGFSITKVTDWNHLRCIIKDLIFFPGVNSVFAQCETNIKSYSNKRAESRWIIMCEFRIEPHCEIVKTQARGRQRAKKRVGAEKDKRTSIESDRQETTQRHTKLRRKREKNKHSQYNGEGCTVVVVAAFHDLISDHCKSSSSFHCLVSSHWSFLFPLYSLFAFIFPSFFPSRCTTSQAIQHSQYSILEGCKIPLATKILH